MNENSTQKQRGNFRKYGTEHSVKAHEVVDSFVRFLVGAIGGGDLFYKKVAPVPPPKNF